MCVGFLFLILYGGLFSSPPASRRLLFTHIFLPHTIFVNHLCQPTISHTPSLTIIFINHHFTHHLLHTPSLTHIFVPSVCMAGVALAALGRLWLWWLAPLCHTHTHTTIFDTPSFTHHLSHTHTTLSHALFHTQLSYTPSFTHNFVTHNIFLRHTQSFTYNFVAHTHNFVLLAGPPPHPLSFLLSRPATTCGAHYWKKLPCGVIRSFNFLSIALTLSTFLSFCFSLSVLSPSSTPSSSSSSLSLSFSFSGSLSPVLLVFFLFLHVSFIKSRKQLQVEKITQSTC